MAERVPAELTVPMSVLELWLKRAFKAGQDQPEPWRNPEVVWVLAEDDTLSPLIRDA